MMKICWPRTCSNKITFLSVCANFSNYVTKDTLRLGIKNKWIYFVLLSVCCIFSLLPQA